MCSNLEHLVSRHGRGTLAVNWPGGGGGGLPPTARCRVIELSPAATSGHLQLRHSDRSGQGRQCTESAAAGRTASLTGLDGAGDGRTSSPGRFCRRRRAAAQSRPAHSRSNAGGSDPSSITWQLRLCSDGTERLDSGAAPHHLVPRPAGQSGPILAGHRAVPQSVRVTSYSGNGGDLIRVASE